MTHLKSLVCMIAVPHIRNKDLELHKFIHGTFSGTFRANSWLRILHYWVVFWTPLATDFPKNCQSNSRICWTGSCTFEMQNPWVWDWQQTKHFPKKLSIKLPDLLNRILYFWVLSGVNFWSIVNHASHPVWPRAQRHFTQFLLHKCTKKCRFMDKRVHAILRFNVALPRVFPLSVRAGIHTPFYQQKPPAQ